MKISLGISDIIILSISLQGLVLAVMLFYSSKKIPGNRWLAAFISLITYGCLVTEAFILFSPDKYPWLIILLARLRMAFGPLLYFYTRSLMYGYKRLPAKSYLHFLPLLLEMGPQVLYLLYASGLLAIPFIQKIYALKVAQFYFFGQGLITDIPFYCLFTVYAALCYRMIRKDHADEEVSSYKLSDIKWLRKLLLVIFVLFLLGIVSALLADRLSPGMAAPLNVIMPFLLAVFAYWLGMYAYIRQNKMSAGDVLEYNKPPVKIYFTAADADKYHSRLIGLMEVDKIYLDPNLKVEVLADRLGVSGRFISNLLNQHLGKNFNDLINEYRVMEAKKRLAGPEAIKFTIAAIAFDCGFNSLATFQRCFKQFTGLTPTQYQNGLKAAPDIL